MKARILVVDDEDAIRRSLTMMFEFEGFDCETGVPTYDSTIGPPPIELLSCAAAKQLGQ